ncbi:MAG: 3'(2'),5'-bisphosphate nucleotidase CysQ [Spirochaetales bacterium]|nr:3'(2'),5'-bisphosphate nucleotidase CysQ [Spirochaetales bacterium]
MVDKDYKRLFQQLAEISVRAGDEIMKIYSGNFDFDMKEDDSPVTDADRAAHDIISEALEVLEFDGALIPVLSEEGDDIAFEERKHWERYWLIDPLDGTKEFISRNGEFTVNIAIISGNKPILGIVYLPVKDKIYYGGAGLGAYKASGRDCALSYAEILPIKTGRNPDILVAAGSRSHRTPDFDLWVESEAKRRGCSRVEVLTAGSSLKLCLAAEGKVDVCPRFGPTMEWDTAAAHAIVEGAGKKCTRPDGGRLIYNKPVMRNDGFIVS